MNKRGQGLSTTTIILIVLGLVVLVVLAIGFSKGWDKIAPWLGGDNVDDIQSQCQTACLTNSEYGYCLKERELKADGLVGGKAYGSCASFATYSSFQIYGIEDCSGLCSNDAKPPRSKKDETEIPPSDRSGVEGGTTGGEDAGEDESPNFNQIFESKDKARDECAKPGDFIMTEQIVKYRDDKGVLVTESCFKVMME